MYMYIASTTSPVCMFNSSLHVTPRPSPLPNNVQMSNQQGVVRLTTWPPSTLYQGKGVTVSSSGVTGRGAECPPETSDQEILADLLGKKPQGKMEKGGKWRRKEGKLWKGRWKIENGRRKYTFQNDKNLFWVYQKQKFSTEKKEFTPGKKSGKMTLPPQKKILLCPWWAQTECPRTCSALCFQFWYIWCQPTILEKSPWNILSISNQIKCIFLMWIKVFNIGY